MKFRPVFRSHDSIWPFEEKKILKIGKFFNENFAKIYRRSLRNYLRPFKIFRFTWNFGTRCKKVRWRWLVMFHCEIRHKWRQRAKINRKNRITSKQDIFCKVWRDQKKDQLKIHSKLGCMRWPIFNSTSAPLNCIFLKKFLAHFFQRSKLHQTLSGLKKNRKKNFNSSETPLSQKIRKIAFRRT